MAQHFKSWAVGLAASFALGTAVAASGVSPSVDQVVNDCVYHAGVTGTYLVTPVRYGSVAAYSVPPGAGVSGTQSQQINTCIERAVQGTPKRTRRTVAARPDSYDGCLAEYKHKMRTSRDGRDYRGASVGTRVFSGLFGRQMGRRLIEHEYDRCLDRIAYDNDRCPTGAFTGGSGYCIRRPLW